MDKVIAAVILTVFLQAVAYMISVWTGFAYERVMLCVLTYFMCYFAVVVVKAIGGNDDD